MQRIPVSARTNLDQRIQETGFGFASIDGEPYWDESAYYRFTLAEIEDHLETPSAELSALCLDLAGRAARDENILRRLGIPASMWDLIADSWNRQDPSLYGRFDFAYGGANPAKLLEYNADTPTALFEASVFQWTWLEDAIAQELIPCSGDQFNSIHEALLSCFAELGNNLPGDRIHFAGMTESIEDRGLLAYLAGVANQAGLKSVQLHIADIGASGHGPFLDLGNQPIQLLFKLYPWEWMWEDEFIASPSMKETRFLEPAWKAVLSNKGILPLLWELEPGHPNLLPCYFENEPPRAKLSAQYVRKPLFAREGCNIALIKDGRTTDATGGPYRDGAYVVQDYAPVPCFAGNYPVIGSWIVSGKPCGIGVREDKSPIVQNTSRFIPHAIID
jgi:glutathionylspermidine synthase